MHHQTQNSKGRGGGITELREMHYTGGLIGPALPGGCYVWNHGAGLGAAGMVGVSTCHLGGSERIEQL